MTGTVKLTREGPGSVWVCLGPVAVCRFLISCRKDFTTGVDMTMRISEITKRKSLA